MFKENLRFDPKDEKKRHCHTYSRGENFPKAAFASDLRVFPQLGHGSPLAIFLALKKLHSLLKALLSLKKGDLKV